MNNLLNVSLTDEVHLALESMGADFPEFKIEAQIAELNACGARLRQIDALTGIALEAAEGEQTTLMQRIKELIKKIVEFAYKVFAKIKEYTLKFVDNVAGNARALGLTQQLLDEAIARTNRPRNVATEGFSTGTIPVPAPKFLHIEYGKIASETQNLESLATSYFRDTVQLLTLQLKHCKYVIEAYNKLMNSPDASLEEFDRTCQRVVEDGERQVKELAHFKVFDCIEIVQANTENRFGGVLNYRASIKPPSREDMQVEPGRFTTNLMRAQDLQDRLVSLNDEIVKYAAQIKSFFVQNSKNFLDSLNKLNDSATRTGTFDAHSEYISQVHNYLVRGNLFQVVMGLNVLNSVWKSVHGLNTHVVKEFLHS